MRKNENQLVSVLLTENQLGQLIKDLKFVRTLRSRPNRATLCVLNTCQDRMERIKKGNLKKTPFLCK